MLYGINPIPIYSTTNSTRACNCWRQCWKFEILRQSSLSYMFADSNLLRLNRPSGAMHIIYNVGGQNVLYLVDLYTYILSHTLDLSSAWSLYSKELLTLLCQVYRMGVWQGWESPDQILFWFYIIRYDYKLIIFKLFIRPMRLISIYWQCKITLHCHLIELQENIKLW